MATHFSILVWEIPWTEEPGGLQSIASREESDVTEYTCTPFFDTQHLGPWVGFLCQGLLVLEGQLPWCNPGYKAETQCLPLTFLLRLWAGGH